MKIDKELKNIFLISISKLNYAYASIQFIIIFGFKFVLNKINRNKYKNYPIRTRPLFLLNKFYTNYYVFKTNPQATLNEPFYYRTSLFTFKADPDFYWDVIFKSNIEDSEILCSISRLYWLVYDYKTLKITTFSKSIRLIKHWINSVPYERSSIFWESYNVSERITSITNALILQHSYNGLISTVQNDLEISNYLKLSLSHLLKNLEYYPNGISYNHVVNNLKGILTIAILFEDDELLNTTSILFFKELEILLLNDGFIREGSSHYQFIVTRWVIELEWLCKLSCQTKLKERLEEWNIKLLETCFFYMVMDKEHNKINIPLIGDVSPDFEPEWVIDYFKCICNDDNNNNVPLSYGHLILEELGYYRKFKIDKTHKNFTNTIISRLEYFGWTLFIRHQAHDGSFFPNHSHDDFSSFVLYYEGVEIVGDPGRLNYTKENISLNYLSHTSHNVISVDGLSIQSTELNRHIQPKFYKYNHCTTDLFIDLDQIKFSVQAESLKRISGIEIINYNRNFILSKDNFIVEDYLSGTGSCIISNQIILNPNFIIIGLPLNRFLLQNKSINIEVSSNKVDWEISPLGRYSERYISETKCFKLIYNSRDSIPYFHKMQFNIN